MVLILASQSPRRAALLRALGYRFRIVVPEVAEIPAARESARAFVCRMADAKAEAVARRRRRPALILAADTVVTLDGCLLGKPRDARAACCMLRRLSGRTHRVLTGFCVAQADAGRMRQRVVSAVCTQVTFKPLSTAAIAAYVAGGEPMDKAGAYAIQGAAAPMVQGLRGSYTNVVGLPLTEVVEVLEKVFNFPPPGARQLRLTNRLKCAVPV